MDSVNNEARPWLKSYKLGPFKLAESLSPYPELPLYNMLDQSADKHPFATAIDYMGERLNYSELRDLVARLATALSDLGVNKGDRVVTILPTCPQYIISNFAILRCGAVHVPCSILHSVDELVFEIREAGAKTVICLEEKIDKILQVREMAAVEVLIVTSINDYTAEQQEIAGKDEDKFYDLRALIANYQPTPPEINLNPREDLAYLAFTGGATGVPKGVMLTHYNRYCNVMQVMPWALARMDKAIKGKASVLIAVPLFHSYGDATALFAVYWGLRMILVQDPRNINAILNLLVENRPFLAAMVPTQMMKLQEKDVPRMPVQIISGASYLPVDVREKLADKLKMPVSEGYGLTETSPITHIDLTGFSKITGFSASQKYSIGIPVPDTDIKLIDEDTGKAVQPGEPGHMYIKGPQVMKGYWPEKGNGLVDGWLPTGDIAKMDDDGYFYIVDRIKDMANVSGYKVYTSTIDDLLHKHPAVSMAAAIGVPDSKRVGSERIKVFIVLKEQYRGKVDADEIVAYCREKCSAYAVPSLVEFRDELPLTVTEKIFKRQLREEEIKKIKGE